MWSAASSISKSSISPGINNRPGLRITLQTIQNLWHDVTTQALYVPVEMEHGLSQIWRIIAVFVVITTAKALYPVKMLHLMR
jgi:hypothetical protein